MAFHKKRYTVKKCKSTAKKSSPCRLGGELPPSISINHENYLINFWGFCCKSSKPEKWFFKSLEHKCQCLLGSLPRYLCCKSVSIPDGVTSKWPFLLGFCGALVHLDLLARTHHLSILLFSFSVHEIIFHGLKAIHNDMNYERCRGDGTSNGSVTQLRLLPFNGTLGSCTTTELSVTPGR